MKVHQIPRVLLLVTVLLPAGSAATLRAQESELALGAQLPLATLSRASADGGARALGTLKGQNGTIVVFWSNECPWAAKYEDRLSTLARTYGQQGFSFVLVNSNDATAYPKEGQPESVRHAAGLGAVYLMDEDGQLARAFGAVRTPHAYVFGGNGALVYAGTIDDSPGDPGNAQEHYLRVALDALAGGVDIAVPRTKAFGCNVKLAGAN